MSVARLMDTAILLLLVTALWAPVGADYEATGLWAYVRYALFGGFSLAIVLLASLQNKTKAVLVLPPAAALLAIFLAQVAISAVWSESITSSLIKAALISLAAMAALMAATARPVDAILRQVVLAAAVFAVLGFLAAILVPSLGVETGWLLEGKWRGISGQKNGFGATVAFVIVAVVVLMLGRRDRNGRPAVMLPAALLTFLGFNLLMSGSRGAQLILLVGLATVFYINLPSRLQNFALVLAGLVVIPLIPLAALTFHADATQLGIFGLTFDTSSRTQIWAYGLQQLGGHELFGFGVSGFWTPERMQIFKDHNGWVLDNFHNGYVTVLIESGLVGIALLLGIIALGFFHLRKRAYRASRMDILAFAFFNMLVVLNLVENEFGRSTSYFFIVFLLIVFSLARRAETPERVRAENRPPEPRLTTTPALEPGR